MKYKLKKYSEKLQGNFKIGKIYKAEPYSPNAKLIILKDDNNKKYIINIKKSNFKEYFLNVNKERKEKLIQIENVQ